MAYIYKITNLINNKCYIGKTLNTIQERWREHCSDYKKRDEEKRPLYSAMKKYGIENFKIEEIEKCNSDIVNDREKYWIEYYGSFKNGYNATLGGDGKAYIDRELVIMTYQKVQNQNEVAKICNISTDSVHDILVEKNISIKSSRDISRENFGKSVIMLDLNNNYIKSFSTLKDAARYIKPKDSEKILQGVSSHIRDVCNKKRQTAYKYKWQWLK